MPVASPRPAKNHTDGRAGASTRMYVILNLALSKKVLNSVVHSADSASAFLWSVESRGHSGHVGTL